MGWALFKIKLQA